MSHRPYPNAARATRHMRRATSVQRCRICQHPVSAHARVGGVHVCTRSRDGQAASCGACAREIREFPLSASLREFMRLMRTPPSGPPELVGAAVYRD